MKCRIDIVGQLQLNIHGMFMFLSPYVCVCLCVCVFCVCVCLCVYVCVCDLLNQFRIFKNIQIYYIMHWCSGKNTNLSSKYSIVASMPVINGYLYPSLSLTDSGT